LSMKAQGRISRVREIQESRFMCLVECPERVEKRPPEPGIKRQNGSAIVSRLYRCRGDEPRHAHRMIAERPRARL
jgi:hypothetical protein